MPGKYPGIPSPGATVESHNQTLQALKESVEQLIGVRGGKDTTAVKGVVSSVPGRPGDPGPPGKDGAPGAPGAPGAVGPLDSKTYGRKNGVWVDIDTARYVRVRTVSTTLNNAVVNGITGLLRFDTIDEDTDGYMVGSAPWTGVKVPVGLAGVYIINGWSSGSGNQSTTLGMGVLVNSTQLTGTNQSISGPGSVNYTLDNAAVAILRLNDGDVVELFNTSVTGVSDTFRSVFMSVARIGG